MKSKVPYLAGSQFSIKRSDGPILPVGFYFDIFILLITVVFQFSLSYFCSFIIALWFSGPK